MDSATLHLIHRIVVSLFLLIYIVKIGALLVNKSDQIREIKWLKITEMVVSFLFLATGIWMLIDIPEITNQFAIKLALVFLSIPLAIVGLKKKNKILGVLSIFCLLGAYGLAEVHKKKIKEGKEIILPAESNAADDSTETVALGKAVFEAKCVVCHGTDGQKGSSGAANLTESTLTLEAAVEVISEGRKQMPAYGLIMSQEEVTAVAEYIQQFKQ